ncbi:MAG: EMC3/TMCO1 family protein [Candidatus Rehaiarchaeum fermentans]|nr:EMC3/TMCO1 family protein [Candidatus Rehaiarchaeum fermentans]
MNQAFLLIIISIFIGLISQISYFLISDREKIKNIRKRAKEMSEKLKLTKDENEIKKIYAEMVSNSTELMKESLKPTLYTFIPFLLVFYLIASYFSYYPIVPGSSIQIFNNSAISFINCESSKIQNHFILNYTPSCIIKTNNATFQLAGIENKSEVVSYSWGKIYPEEVGINTPFAFINWFWIYFIVSFLSSFIFSNILERLGF